MTTTSSPPSLSDETPARGVPVVSGAPESEASDALWVPEIPELDGISSGLEAPPSVDLQVAAVIVTDGVTPYLPGLIASVLAQTVLPHEVLIVDVSANGPLVLPVGTNQPPQTRVTVVGASRAKTFGQGVGMALKQSASVLSSQWLWLLHDDTVVEPDVLEKLRLQVQNSSSISIAGAKQVRLGSPKDLINVGYSVASGGQRLSGVELSEFDQGQHDAREDVFAVSLNAALVRTSLWLQLKSTDPTYGRFGDSLDFCRRARLAGHRVVVVPDAVVEHAQATLVGTRDAEEFVVPAKDSLLDDRQDNRNYFAKVRAGLYFSATSFSAPMVPIFWLLSILAAPFRSLYRIAAKQPRRAVEELLVPLWFTTKLGSALGAAVRMSLIKQVPRSAVRELMLPQRQVWAHHRDLQLARGTLRRQLYGPSDLDEKEFKQVRQRRHATFFAILLSLCVLTLFAFSDLMSGFGGAKRIIGGALLPAQSTLADLWQSWTGGWIRDGLGASAPADPIVISLMPSTLLAGGNAQLAVNITVLLALVLSGVGAWFAAGAVTRGLTVRTWITLLWVAAPSLLLALGQGRLGAVVVHLALPWFVVALIRAFGLQAEDQRSKLRFRQQQEAEKLLEDKLAQKLVELAGEVDENSPSPISAAEANPLARPPQARSLAALGGAALAFAVIIAGSPSLLVPGLLILTIIAFVVPRARLLLVIPIPAVAVMGPLLVRGFINRGHQGWRILFADPGVPTPYEPGPSWQTLLSLPLGHRLPNLSEGVWPAITALLPYTIGGLVLLGAMLALLRTGAGAKPIRLMWVIASLGFAAAVISSRVVVASGSTGGITGWAGTGISVAYLGLLGACAVGATGLSSKALSFNFGWRQILLGTATLLIFVVPLGALVSWAQNRSFAEHTSALKVLDRSIVPAVAQQMQNSARQARILAISPNGLDGVDYQLFHRDGAQMLEASTVVNVTHMDGRPDDIADLVGHLSRGLEEENLQPAVIRLGAMGVGAILVPAADSPEVANLISRLDTVIGLQRVTENETGTLWRVDPVAVQADATELQETLGTGEDEATNFVVIPTEPSWAAVYEQTGPRTLDNAATVEATRLSVDAVLAPGRENRVIVIAENAAPGWTARLDGVSLPRVTVNEMQGFDLSGFSGAGGNLEIGYERASQIPWLILQGTVLVVFVLLAIPMRRRGLR